MRGEERGVARARRVLGRLNRGKLARRSDVEGREVFACFERALAPAQVRDGRAAEDVLGVLCSTTAGRGVERVNGDALVCGDATARLKDGAVCERVLGRATAVDLRARVGREVEAVCGEATDVADGVCARGDGLRLQRFNFRPAARRKLVRHDAAHVVFERDDVDDRQSAARVREDFEATAVRLLVEADGASLLVVRGEDDGRALVHERPRRAGSVKRLAAHGRCRARSQLHAVSARRRSSRGRSD